VLAYDRKLTPRRLELELHGAIQKSWPDHKWSLSARSGRKTLYTAGHASVSQFITPSDYAISWSGGASNFKRPIRCGMMSLSQSDRCCQTLKDCSTLLSVVVSAWTWRRPSSSPSPPVPSSQQCLDSRAFCRIRTQFHRLLDQDRVQSPKTMHDSIYVTPINVEFGISLSGLKEMWPHLTWNPLKTWACISKFQGNRPIRWRDALCAEATF